jgi:hypothetical protein
MIEKVGGGCYGVVLALGAKPTREHRLCIADLHRRVFKVGSG